MCEKVWAMPNRSRRRFLHLAGAAPLVFAPLAHAAPKKKGVPVGIEIYSVREEEKKDLPGTLAALAAMGYEGVEFWAPYLDWTPAQAKEVRQRLDGLGLRCFSTHNRDYYFTPENLARAIERNALLGSRYVVMAGAPKSAAAGGLDGWKKLADELTRAHEAVKKAGLRCGFHNLTAEWKPVGGQRPIDVLVANTPADFAFQVDTATCMAAGGDPVAFVQANPGRVRSFHLKDWSPRPEEGYKVLLGEGIGQWKKLAEVAEAKGGVEYYLIEQEGSRLPAMETARRCLDSFRKLRAG
jgi:sugar phosphate isomerase/epimerase